MGIRCIIFTFFLLKTLTTFSQVVKADKDLVCPEEPVKLTARLSELDYCLLPTGSRFGLYYFRTCRQVNFKDALWIARLLGGNLATANTQEKNVFIKGMLPNDIHWIGYVQNPLSKTFNDPPDPSSGFEWLSGEAVNMAFWAPGEPNNREDTSPGMVVVQGCRRDEYWCDVEPHLKFMAMLESTSPVIPVVPPSSILWETGETTESITVKPLKSKYYHVTVTVAGEEIKDSVFVGVREAKLDFSAPGGCGPFLWKPGVEINGPLSDYEITWKFGNLQQNNILKPEFKHDLEEAVPASVSVRSRTCNLDLQNRAEVFDLRYPFVPAQDRQEQLKLNQKVTLSPLNKGDFSYHWSPAEGLSDATTARPQFTAAKDINYTVTIADKYGCETKEIFSFTIDPRIRIFTPTAFSPNQDTRNDVFELIFEDGFYGKPEQLEIFDRWGTSVYATKEKPWSWDGYINNKPAPVGAYQFIAGFSIEGVKYKKTGAFELMR